MGVLSGLGGYIFFGRTPTSLGIYTIKKVLCRLRRSWMTGVGRACPRWSWPVEAISWSWWTAGTGSWSCRPLMRISWWWSVPPLILSWGRTSSPSLTFFTFWVRAPFGTKVQYTVLLWLNGLMVRVPVSTDRPSRVPISVRALPTVWVEGGRSRTVNTVKTQSVRVQILDSAVKKITFFSSWKHHRPLDGAESKKTANNFVNSKKFAQTFLFVNNEVR